VVYFVLEELASSSCYPDSYVPLGTNGFLFFHDNRQLIGSAPSANQTLKGVWYEHLDQLRPNDRSHSRLSPVVGCLFELCFCLVLCCF
jgi:hypothetical protein